MSENRVDITSSLTFGFVFISIGILALLNETGVLSLSWRYILPIVLIVAGLAIIVSSQAKQRR